MKNIFQIIELIMGDEELDYGIQAISLVDEGAIERDFVHFKKEEVIKLEIHDEEKRMVMGPVLIPLKPIYRRDHEGEYHVHFSAKTVRAAAQRFMKLGNQDQTTYQHEVALEDVIFVESWVKESLEFDKSMIYGDGYKDTPVGTWFAMARIDDDKVWGEIKNGTINSFSIEGRFADFAIQQNKLKAKFKLDKEDYINTPEDIATLDKIKELLEGIDPSELD